MTPAAIPDFTWQKIDRAGLLAADTGIGVGATV